MIDRQIELFDAGREDTLLGMKQLSEMAYAMRDAIESGDIGALGVMLREAFEAKKRMNPHIAEDTPIEAMLEAASRRGRDRRQDLRRRWRRLPADRGSPRGARRGPGSARGDGRTVRAVRGRAHGRPGAPGRSPLGAHPSMTLSRAVTADIITAPVGQETG